MERQRLILVLMVVLIVLVAALVTYIMEYKDKTKETPQIGQVNDSLIDSHFMLSRVNGRVNGWAIKLNTRFTMKESPLDSVDIEHIIKSTLGVEDAMVFKYHGLIQVGEMFTYEEVTQDLFKTLQTYSEQLNEIE
jgi:hypothetical protein